MIMVLIAVSIGLMLSQCGVVRSISDDRHDARVLSGMYPPVILVDAYLGEYEDVFMLRDSSGQVLITCNSTLGLLLKKRNINDTILKR